MKKLFENFWLIFLVMLGTAILDLIGLTFRDADFGAGFVLAFLYFMSWTLYKILEK
jgi:hypothetical protein